MLFGQCALRNETGIKLCYPSRNSIHEDTLVTFHKQENIYSTPSRLKNERQQHTGKIQGEIRAERRYEPFFFLIQDDIAHFSLVALCNVLTHI